MRINVPNLESTRGPVGPANNALVRTRISILIPPDARAKAKSHVISARDFETKWTAPGQETGRNKKKHPLTRNVAFHTYMKPAGWYFGWVWRANFFTFTFTFTFTIFFFFGSWSRERGWLIHRYHELGLRAFFTLGVLFCSFVLYVWYGLLYPCDLDGAGGESYIGRTGWGSEVNRCFIYSTQICTCCC